nr:MAG TPA: hypothetical protein [Caudoviricetes sp.]
MTDEAATGHADNAQYLARELARVQEHAISSAAILIDAGGAIADLCATTDVQRTYIRKTIGDAVDALVDGLYPQIGDERDE